MSIQRTSNRKVYSFKSVGKTTEQARKLARSLPEQPPVGIKTPMKLAEKGENFLEMHTNYPDQIHDNLINLILTNHGERLGHPMFGANLAELTFEMQDEAVQGEAMARISTAVRKFMPYVSLETFVPIVDHFDNAQIAKVGVALSYKIPKLRTEARSLEVILYAAG